jgi:hypothetical protein
VQATFADSGRRLLTVARRDDSVAVSIWDTVDWRRETGPLAVPMSGDLPTIRAALSPSLACVALHSFLPLSGRGGLLSPTVTIQPLDGERAIELHHDQGVTGAAFDVTGSYLLTISVDDSVRVWDAESGELVRRLRLDSSDGELVGAEFSSDGRRIVTSSSSGFRIWDLATGQPLSALVPLGREGPRSGGGLWSTAADRYILLDQGQVVVHDLSPDRRSIDQLQRMTSVLSGRRVNQRGNVETLSPDQLQQQWEDCREPLRDRLKDALAGEAWHRLQAEKADDAYAATWHLTRLLEANPHDGDLLVRRGQLLAEQQRHEEALADFEAALVDEDVAKADFDAALSITGVSVRSLRADSLGRLERWDEAAAELKLLVEDLNLVKLMVEELNVAPAGGQFVDERQLAATEALAIARLLAGDRAGYDEACRNLFPIRNHVLLRAALLVPREKEYCDWIAEQLGSTSNGSNNALATVELASTQALLALRYGDAEKVVELLGSPRDPMSSRDLLVLAMARQQLQQEEEAIRLFTLAGERMRQGDMGSVSSLVVSQRVWRPAWVDAATVELLYREAEQMIHNESPESDSQAADDE